MTGRLAELAQYVPRGPWRARRSSVDGSLCLYAGDGPDAEPLALIYAGADFGHYLEACAPARLFGGPPVEPELDPLDLDTAEPPRSATEEYRDELEEGRRFRREDRAEP